MSEGSCHFYVERKKRYCRMTVKSGNKYCGEHLRSDVNYYQSILGIERVPCPLDPTHSCYKSKLPMHLKKCNARKNAEPKPYIVKNYNAGDSGVSIFQTPLSQIDQGLIDRVIEKINKAYEHLPSIAEEILSHGILEDELKIAEYGNTTRKHLLQTSSLLEHLNRAGLVSDGTCFIDFGAGKGKLTYWLAKAIKEQKESSILLIDRSSLRHQWDNKLKNEDYAVNVHRIRADIADLKLTELQQLSNKSKIVAVAKHLCGIATDLALQCLANAIRDANQQIIQGLVIAFCCHHRCDYNSYVGKDFLTKNGFTVEEFPILCSIATWATCGFDKQNNKPGNDEVNRTKEYIGRKVKNLLNWGRVEFLRAINFDCRLVQYVRPDVSLENTCIVAVRNND